MFTVTAVFSQRKSHYSNVSVAEISVHLQSRAYLQDGVYMATFKTVALKLFDSSNIVNSEAPSYLGKKEYFLGSAVMMKKIVLFYSFIW